MDYNLKYCRSSTVVEHGDRDVEERTAASMQENDTRDIMLHTEAAKIQERDHGCYPSLHKSRSKSSQS